MKCPKCGEEIKENVSIIGFITKKKRVTYFCPLCDFSNTKEFIMTLDDIRAERRKRTIVYKGKKS